MQPSFLRDQSRWTLPAVLRARAAQQPDENFIVTVEGEALTYGQALAQAGQVGSLLQRCGIGPGDTVAVLMPNSLDFVRVWLGTACVGATLAPLNPALTGEFLAHQLRSAGAKLLVCHPDYLAAAAAAIEDSGSIRAVLSPGDAAHLHGIDVEALARWRDLPPCEPVPVQPSDTACIMFTSGTTGRSKGVLMPHAHCYVLGLGVVDNLRLTQADRYYICMPLYHANALFMQLYGTLIAGASAVLRTRFSATEWLSDIRRHGCSITHMLGAMSQFVIGQPPLAADRDHRLRAIVPAPNPPQHEHAWRTRFGIAEVVSAYGTTEANVPLWGRLGESRPGCAGYAYQPYFEVSLRDPDTEQPVAAGTVGEICVRSTVPFGFSAGYKGLPDATVQAWRNFWYHTGDLGVSDEQGCVSYVDRRKDCIRRRGENISSFEVELAMAQHPGVREVAAVAMPAEQEGVEDEVMLAIVPATPALSVDEIVAYADSVLPRFAKPRFVRFLDALPKTPTERVQKALLRQQGIAAGTWDRERQPI